MVMMLPKSLIQNSRKSKENIVNLHKPLQLLLAAIVKKISVLWVIVFWHENSNVDSRIQVIW